MWPVSRLRLMGALPWRTHEVRQPPTFTAFQMELVVNQVTVDPGRVARVPCFVRLRTTSGPIPSALRMAISAQRPSAGLIHHSDRGVQYASADYRKLMQSADLKPSMSRKGDCHDNALMESFFHTLKTEFVHHRHYATRADSTRDLFAYIEGF